MKILELIQRLGAARRETMWMTEYVNEIKRQFRDVYGFVPTGGTEAEPLFADGTIPDGEYPMTIDGKLDRVKLVAGHIHCCYARTEGR